MRLLSLYSIEKEMCLQDVLNQKTGEFWTSGTDQGCPGMFRWCAGMFTGILKPNLRWRKNRGNASCVTVQNDPVNAAQIPEAVLGTENCEMELNFICESRPPHKDGWFWSSTEECKAVNRLTNKERSMLKPEFINSFSYRMKCYLQCVAETNIMVSGGGDILLDNLVRYVQGTDFKISTDNWPPYKEIFTNDTVEHLGGYLNVITMMASRAKMERDFDIGDVRKKELLLSTDKCLIKVSIEPAECVYVYELLRCVVNDSDVFVEAWKELGRVKLSGFSVDWNGAYTSPRNISAILIKNLLQFTPILSDQHLSSECINNVLVNSQTVLQTCLDINGNFVNVAEGKDFVILRALSSGHNLEKCLVGNGTSIFAATADEFENIFNMLNAMRFVLGIDAAERAVTSERRRLRSSDRKVQTLRFARTSQ
ncbi:Hypothetical predicted protein [Cloeon dipterum]|uniref:C-type lectin domain-containing protein n=1 Tax=Cloeon dipterum TaxID=197152 RepID=A0A8S1DEY9_9INSE|nr:Hypothetical predicted protein [Cloeon dipterum]